MENMKKNKLKGCKIDNYEILKDEKGNQYSGECEGRIPNGFGIKESEDEIYEGEWKDNLEHGHGKLYVKNRFVVEG